MRSKKALVFEKHDSDDEYDEWGLEEDEWGLKDEIAQEFGLF